MCTLGISCDGSYQPTDAGYLGLRKAKFGLGGIVGNHREVEVIFIRSSLAIALNFGKCLAASSTSVAGLGSNYLPTSQRMRREVPKCFHPVTVGCVEFDGRGQV